MGVPNVSYKVEIAWTSNWLTPAVDRVWTDVSAYVELGDGGGPMKIDYGRSDELSTADANTLSLTLDNSDGRFTWGNASSPYYPNVKIGRPIRVTATIGGNDYVRFVGLVNEWPVEWPGDSPGYATASITASSRLSRLGLSAPRNAARVFVPTTAGATAMWPLDDDSSSTSGRNIITESGWGPMLAERRLAQWGGSEGPVGTGSSVVRLPTDVLRPSRGEVDYATYHNKGFALGLWVRMNDYPSDAIGVQVARLQPASVNGYEITVAINSAGSVAARARVVGSISSGGGTVATLAPGDAIYLFVAAQRVSPTSWHYIVTANDTVAFEGNLTDDGSITTSPDPMKLALGVVAWESGLSADVSFADVSVYPGATAQALTSADGIALAGAVSGYYGDTTDERIERLAAWAKISPAEIITSPSAIKLVGTGTDDAQVETLMRQAETAEGGVLYDNRSGTLTLQPRGVRYNASPALTVPFTTARVSGYAPKVDLQGLANVGKGRGPDGNEVTYNDETSRDEYGDAGYDVETIALSPDEPLQLIAWRINSNSQPRPRVPNVKFEVIDWIADPNLQWLLALNVSWKLRFTDAPAQAPTTSGTVDYFVEGYTEELGIGTWSISPNLSPVALEDSVFVLDDPVLGQLDAGNVLGL